MLRVEYLISEGKWSLPLIRSCAIQRSNCERSNSPFPLSWQAATGFEIGEQAVNLGVAVQARQLLSDVVAQ